MSSGTPAAAQAPDISGHYEGDLILESEGGEGALLCGGFNGTLPADAEVRVTGDAVHFDVTFEGGGFPIDASLDQELGVYTELTGPFTSEDGDSDSVSPFSGQFDVSGPQPSFTGRQLSTDRCEVQTDPPTFTTATTKMTIALVRVSGGGGEPGAGGTDAAASPPPPPTSGAEPGRGIAIQLGESVCDPEDPDPSDDCRAARTYGFDWAGAMDDDVRRLQLDFRSDAYTELASLQAILFEAAFLGGLLDDVPSGRVSRFPVVHALLPVFASLFIQGVTLAGRGQIDSLRRTVAQTDALLFAAVAEETRTGSP